MSTGINEQISNTIVHLCRTATNKEGDTFVGIKSELIDGQHQLTVNFPIGYQISDNEEDVRDEIVQLVTVLQEYNDEQSQISTFSNEQLLKTVRFPVQSYFYVMFDYLNHGEFTIKEDKYAQGTSGPISWSQTIKKEKPIVQKNGFVYPQQRVKTHNDTDKDLITEIHRYCVYQSYLKLGWIYNLPLPVKPIRKHDNTTYLKYLQSKFLQTNRDSDKKLFQAMLDILNFCNTEDDPKQFYFGTNSFEYVWERLIQSTFGNIDKSRFFPKTTWKLRVGVQRENHPLEPDTIMVSDGDIYILDAKYYKYGISLLPKDLPNSSSINKQISYGEYVATDSKFESERSNGMQIYNAFLMPYNMHSAPMFSGEKYLAIGEATADWKDYDINPMTYSRIQGILIDVKSLMSNKIKGNTNEIIALSKAIIESLEKS
ncbi:LlaJI family restriction endonuclease [Actinotignum urinale]|uniref:LlaJI family restriction endonuclease n=1 Tax=Actinotignum urinale TaxID=190146 RepID=UPI00146C329C|nr:LlaJI family restriction endonuclease [Actinotignum urinale]